MVMAVALVLLVVGTILFHFLSPWWFTPIASNWKMMDDTVNITFVVTGIVFVAVNLFMACAVFLYRHRQGRRAEYSPENKKRSEEHTSELQSRLHLVCRLLLEKKKHH